MFVSMSVSLYQRTVFRNSTSGELEHDLARRVVVEAVPGLATDLPDLDAVERAACEPGPHPAVDLRGFRARAYERTERAGGCRNHGSPVVRVLERGLVAETPDRGAHALEAGLDALRGSESGGPTELAP